MLADVLQEVENWIQGCPHSVMLSAIALSQGGVILLHLLGVNSTHADEK